MKAISPSETLRRLKDGADSRRIKSLDILNSTLQSYVDSGGDNFSIRVIAKLSVTNGGPKEQSIRNKTGDSFKILISSWAEHVRTLKNSTSTTIKSNLNSMSSTKDILKLIDDPALRGRGGILLAERDMYLRELALLKKYTDIVLDKRMSTNEKNMENRVLFTEYELDAIKMAISENFLNRQNWIADSDGRVYSGRKRIYGPGYVTALRKIIENYS